MTVVANRYARALIEALSAGDGGGAAERRLEQLRAIQATLEAAPDARKILMNPVIPPEKRERFIGQIAAALELEGTVRKLLGLLVERRRLELFDDIIDAYQKMLDERNGIVRAMVRSAHPLAESETREIAARFEEKLGKRVVMETVHDPSLVGGFVVRIGSTVYDASLRQQLAGFKEQLLAG